MLSVRKSFSSYSKNKWILKFHNDNEDRIIASTHNLNNLLNKGPVTPDHVIRIKSKILFISDLMPSALASVIFSTSRFSLTSAVNNSG